MFDNVKGAEMSHVSMCDAYGVGVHTVQGSTHRRALCMCIAAECGERYRSRDSLFKNNTQAIRDAHRVALVVHIIIFRRLVRSICAASTCNSDNLQVMIRISIKNISRYVLLCGMRHNVFSV